MKLPGSSSIIADRYQLERAIGEGGFSTVFSATELATGRRVAIKLIKPDRPNGYEPSTRRRLQRELRALGNLRSPHTIRLLLNGETADGVLFAVFEHVDGVELAQVLRDRGRLAPHEVEHVLRQLLEALEEAHRHGILHRDLKPENILVTQLNHDPLFAKLIDFGIARPMDDGGPSITKTGELIGTPRYMSPEQLTERPLTAASDLYSLGMIAYEMALGRDALQGGAWSDQFDRLQSGHVFSVPEFERIGTRLHTVILRMTQREPDARFQSAAQVLTELDRSPEPRPVDVATSPSRRRIPIFIALGLLLVALVAFGVMSFRDTESQRRAPTPQPPRASVAYTPPPVVQPDPPDDIDPVDQGAVKAAAPRGSAGCVDGVVKPPPGLSVYVPDAPPDQPLPLVILLHGRNLEPVEFLNSSGFKALADRDKFMLVAPRSELMDSNLPWTPSDPQRLLGLSGPVSKVVPSLHTTLERYCIDRHRMFAVGFYGDGQGPAHLACEFPLTAMATVSGLARAPSDLCLQGFEYDMPYLRFNPLRGKNVPGFGGKDCGGKVREQGTLNEMDEAWAHGLRCEPTNDPPFDPKGGAQSRRWDCPNGRLESRLVDAGSGWPGIEPPRASLECLGPEPTINYAEEIWAFFQEAQDRPL